MRVSQGEREWVPMLWEFYTPFAKDLEIGQGQYANDKPADEATDEICENCGSPHGHQGRPLWPFRRLHRLPQVPHHPPGQNRGKRG